jgi:hypothetical protein
MSCSECSWDKVDGEMVLVSCEVRLLVLAVCLYPSIAVLTAHDMHVVTMLLAGGQIDFLYLWRQATAVDDYPCLGHYL